MYKNSYKSLYLALLLLAFQILSNVHGEVIASRSFPMELNQKINFRLSSENINSIFRIFIDDQKVAVLVVKTGCKNEVNFLACTPIHASNNAFSMEFTPQREHNLKTIEIRYSDSLERAVNEEYVVQYSAQIELRKTPKEIIMELTSTDDKFFKDKAGIYKRDTKLNVLCKSDGSLPEKNIEFTMICHPRSQALTEQYRLERARANVPIELYYSRYSFAHPPNEQELAQHLADMYARDILELGGVVSGPTDTRAEIKLTKFANDCELVCSQVGVETRKSINVEYENSVVFILPAPEGNYHPAGTDLNCYADGNPPSRISMDCLIPSSSPQPLDHFIDAIKKDGALPEEMGRKGGLLFTVDKKEDIIVYNSDDDRSIDLLRARLNNLRRNEVVKFIPEDRTNSCKQNNINVRGSRLEIRHNATVGLEIFVVCYSDNSQAHARLIINNRFNASLGVVLGICCALLLLSMVIIGIMIMTKRRQYQQRSAFDTRVRTMSGSMDHKPIEKRKNGSASRMANDFNSNLHMNQNRGSLTRYSPARAHAYKYEVEEDEAIMRPGQPGMAAMGAQRIDAFSTGGSVSGRQVATFEPVHRVDSVGRRTPTSINSTPKKLSSLQSSQHTPEAQPLLRNNQLPRQSASSVHSLQQTMPAVPRSVSLTQTFQTATMGNRSSGPRSPHRRQAEPFSVAPDPGVAGNLSPRESSWMIAEEERRAATEHLFGMRPSHASHV